MVKVSAYQCDQCGTYFVDCANCIHTSNYMDFCSPECEQEWEDDQYDGWNKRTWSPACIVTTVTNHGLPGWIIQSDVPFADLPIGMNRKIARYIGNRKRNYHPGTNQGICHRVGWADMKTEEDVKKRIEVLSKQEKRSNGVERSVLNITIQALEWVLSSGGRTWVNTQKNF